ncbi:MAG: divergent polysaccharide deacetylase family protein [Thermodesulfobacteriota bacterium]
MPEKRPGKTRRRPAKKKSGRAGNPAALVFFAGVAVALVVIFFAYAFYYLPGQKDVKTPPAPKPPAQMAPAVPAPPAPVQAAGQAAQPSPAPAPAPAPAPVPAEPSPPAPAPEPKPRPDAPRLTIVMDDLGGSLEQARDILDLGIPVTFSVLPNLKHTSEVDALAAKAGMEVILHQPMEAHGNAPESPGTLHSGASAPDVLRTLDAHLAQVPHAAGVSNHTGSKASEDPVLMASVMTGLKARKLFFLDSLTSARSAGLKQAAAQGVPALARSVFLDNERGQQAALLMLAQAEREAREKGHAVAIGHPHPETVAALAAWATGRDKAIALVTLGSQLKGN